MNLSPTPVSLGQQLFGGLFGTTQTGGNGLFSLAMALFGQGGMLAGQMGQTDQVSPTGLTQLMGTTTPNLPILLGLTEDSAGLTNAQTEANATQPVDWQALLQGLSGDTPLSPDLQKLLGDQAMTLDDLKAKLTALDTDKQQALLGEIAALLAPMIAQSPIPVTTTSGETKTVTLDTNKRTAPPQNLPQQDTAPADAAQQEADSKAAAALNQLTRLLQNHQNAEDKTVADKAVNEAKLSAKANDNANAAQQQQNTVANTLVTTKAEQQASQTETNKAATQDKDNKADDAATADTLAAATQHTQQHTAPKINTHTIAQDHVKTLGDVQAADTSSSDKGNTNANADGMRDTTLPTPTQQAAAKDSAAPSFADQLSKLNRTGAHIPVSDQVAVHLTRAMQDGQDRMTIRLNPAELGRIEVKLDMSADGRVSASFSVDQPATLDLLQRDQKGLERALSDAGLKSDSGSLNFNLRGDGQQHNQQQAQGGAGQGGGQNQPLFNLDGTPVDDTPAGQIEMSWYVNPDRLDVHI